MFLVWRCFYPRSITFARCLRKLYSACSERVSSSSACDNNIIQRVGFLQLKYFLCTLWLRLHTGPGWGSDWTTSSDLFLNWMKWLNLAIIQNHTGCLRKSNLGRFTKASWFYYHTGRLRKYHIHVVSKGFHLFSMILHAPSMEFAAIEFPILLKFVKFTKIVRIGGRYSKLIIVPFLPSTFFTCTFFT